MEYFDLPTMYSLLRPDEPPAAFYTKLRGVFHEYIRRGHARGRPEHNRVLGEELWYELARPYYKVDNESIALFSAINIDIPFRYLQVPFESFLIRFREDNPLGVRTMLVNLGSKFEERPSFYVWVDLGEQEPIAPHLPVLNYVHLPADPEQSISDAIGLLPVDEQTGSDVTGGLDRKLVSIAVSVCFLATSSDKMIRPDVLSKDLAAWLEADRRQDEQRQHTIHERAKRRGKFGFLVDGAREYVHHQVPSNGDGVGRQLSYRHVRCAHFRRLPSGRVTFVRQAMVRPDLPGRNTNG